MGFLINKVSKLHREKVDKDHHMRGADIGAFLEELYRIMGGNEFSRTLIRNRNVYIQMKRKWAKDSPYDYNNLDDEGRSLNGKHSIMQNIMSRDYWDVVKKDAIHHLKNRPR